VATEVRLAFAFNGGVSLAIWIGGVTDEVLRCINGGRLAAEGRVDQAAGNAYAAVCAELGVVPKADVLSGTSAGGLNAAFLATAVSHGCTDLEAIRRLWLEHGSFDLMMRPATDRSLDDFRSTIYWNPNINTDLNTGNASVSFYAADLEGTYRIIAEGISQSGEPMRCEYSVTIKK
jgi:hypothetical protein